MQPDGRNRGPFGPDPEKIRAEREKQLFQLAGMEGGTEIIAAMWKEAKQLPAAGASFGTPIKTIMILELLNHEYPND
jgi:hypothetical protein